MTTRKPYTGVTKKLVLGIDVGTTYSGVSYVLLVPGQIPEIRGVTRFPAQDHVGSDSKIPSVLLYDKLGVARAMGAEALQEQLIEQGEDEGWTRIEWFKLHLRPKGLDTSHMGPLTLPRNKSIVGIYADFLRYLRSCAKTYIEDTHANGPNLWNSVKDKIEYVITHPNGWEGPEQAHLRRAAVEAGLIRDTPSGQKLLQFLTEGEASLHFCVQTGLGKDIIDTGKGVIIADAGGGTIDLSAFAATSGSKYEEISPAQCHFQGSVFVTKRAREYLEEKFAGTRFAEDVPNMANVFDRTTKLRFRSAAEPAYIKFGGLRDKDPEHNIRAGLLTVNGEDVASFFEPSIDSIMKAVLAQHQNSHKPISDVFLVGGFAASEYLFSTLRESLRHLGLTVSRPDAHVNKAVADGAVAFYLDRLVTVRVARFDYGVQCSIDYIPWAMGSRRHLVYTNPKGEAKVPGHFRVILRKGTQVSETQIFKESFSRRSFKLADLENCSVPIRSYHGKMNPCPQWMDMDPENFRVHCEISGDLSSIPKPHFWGPEDYHASWYHEVSCDVNVTFGGSEMTAHLTWTEDGVEKSGPAQVIYDLTDSVDAGASQPESAERSRDSKAHEKGEQTWVQVAAKRPRNKKKNKQGKSK